jgi:hypothetical protein
VSARSIIAIKTGKLEFTGQINSTLTIEYDSWIIKRKNGGENE